MVHLHLSCVDERKLVLIAVGLGMIMSIIFVFQSAAGQQLHSSNISSYLNAPLTTYDNSTLGFKIGYPSTCEKVEIYSFVGFCGWETGVRVGVIGEYSSLEDLTKAVADPNKEGGGNVIITPIKTSQGIMGNKIDVMFNGTAGGGLTGVVLLKDNQGYQIGIDFIQEDKQAANELLNRMLNTFEITK